jgi:hypothetical protein
MVFEHTNGNKIYLFDLAGTEEIAHIMKTDLDKLVNYKEQNALSDEHLLRTSKIKTKETLFPKDSYAIKHLYSTSAAAQEYTLEVGLNSNSILLGELVKLKENNKFNLKSQISNLLTSKLWFLYVFSEQILTVTPKKNKGVYHRNVENAIYKSLLTKNGISKMKDKLDLLLETFYINNSLSLLRKSLTNYNNNNTKNLSEIKEIGFLPKSIPIEKILMFGMIRNDIAYAPGAINTINFLKQLAPPTFPQQNAGSIASSSGIVRNILLEKANNISERAFDAVISKTSMIGGGIVNKSFVDVDKAILIGVSFLIIMVSLHTNKELTEKGYLQRDKDKVSTLLGSFLFFIMLFVALIGIDTMDMYYTMLYIIGFGIVNLSINLFLEEDKQSMIIQNIQGKNNIIQKHYTSTETKMFLTWAMMSVIVIFV